MSTEKQKEAARKNIKKAQAATKAPAKKATKAASKATKSTTAKATAKTATKTATKTANKATKATAKKATKAASKATKATANKATKATATKAASSGMSTAQKNKLADQKFAFPDARKEPLTDASHVRNAISRFDQVEGVSNNERDKAWRRIKTAAKKFGVEVSARSWRQLGDKAKKR